MPRTSLDLDLDALCIVVHRTRQLVPLRERVDEGPKADALHNPPDGNGAALTCRRKSHAPSLPVSV